MMIDTHCHLNFTAFAADRDAVVERARSVGVERLIVPAIDLETLPDVLACADAYEGVFVGVGVHPNSTADFVPDWLDSIQQAASHGRVVAIGEIGLDYHWDDSPKHKQIEAFEAQLSLARELGLPVIIHNREASDDVMAVLEAWVGTLPASMRGRAGVLHSFSGSWGIAERALEAGFYLGFTGPVTFKKADDLRAIVADVPLERLLVETDAPFLTPYPYRGKRNESSYIPYIIEKIADVRGIPVGDVTYQTTRNAEILFGMSL